MTPHRRLSSSCKRRASLQGKVIADIGSGDGIIDIGSGDGIIDIGVFYTRNPAKLLGHDLRETDIDALRRSSLAAGVEPPFPDAEHFAFLRSSSDRIPAPDAMFDFIFSWSVFEHVSEVVPRLRDVAPMLESHGCFFLQFWPLLASQHASTRGWRSRSRSRI